jgi:hypothetical protein
MRNSKSRASLSKGPSKVSLSQEAAHRRPQNSQAIDDDVIVITDGKAYLTFCDFGRRFFHFRYELFTPNL